MSKNDAICGDDEIFELTFRIDGIIIYFSQAEVEHHSTTGDWEGYMKLYRVRHSHDHYIDAQAEVVHHSMTGDWEFYMGRNLGIDFHRFQSPVKL